MYNVESAQEYKDVEERCMLRAVPFKSGGGEEERKVFWRGGGAEFWISLYHWRIYDFWPEGEGGVDFLITFRSSPPHHTFKWNGPKTYPTIENTRKFF